MTEQNTDTRPARVATIIWDGGLRFSAEMRGHTVSTDQPVHAGGTDSAIMPLELLAASLGTCVALYAHQFCAARQIPVDGLGVEVSYETAKAPKRIGRFDVAVQLPDGFPDEYRAAAERAVRTCPVHNTLSHPPEINIDVLAPVAAMAT